MIFVGDIALPYKDAITINMPNDFYNKVWFGNLEGSIVNNNKIFSTKSVVFNDKEAIYSIIKKINFAGFSLANNHILDVGNINDTIKFLDELELSHCGAGKNILEASKPLQIKENNSEIIIINMGWSVIHCKSARKNKQGVNPLAKKNSLNILDNIKRKYKNKKIVFYMHWSYELEAHPQPFERELAMALIDNGADGVIGSHSHCIGEIEIYKNKPIIYSLGNWLFKQNYYYNSKLKFPDFCNLELAFEWDFDNSKYYFHFFYYDINKSEILYLNSDVNNCKYLSEYLNIGKYNKTEYIKYYKKNHYHKKKCLPIYYWDDNEIIIIIKKTINKIIDIVVKIYKNKYLLLLFKRKLIINV